MSAKELTLRVLMALRPMLPGLIAVAAVTLLVLPFLLVACKKACSPKTNRGPRKALRSTCKTRSFKTAACVRR